MRSSLLEVRERQTILPAFDPEVLAEGLEATSEADAAFDPWAYASVLGEGASGTVTARDSFVPRKSSTRGRGEASSQESFEEMTQAIGHAMYSNYLAENYSEALSLAERILEREPEHALAKLVIVGCYEEIGSCSDVAQLGPLSIVVLRAELRENSAVAK